MSVFHIIFRLFQQLQLAEPTQPEPTLVEKSFEPDLLMRVVSWNLRFDSQPDAIDVEDSLKSIPDPLEAPKFMGKSGEQPWSIRRIRVAQELGNNIVIAGS